MKFVTLYSVYSEFIRPSSVVGQGHRDAREARNVLDSTSELTCFQEEEEEEKKKRWRKKMFTAFRRRAASAAVYPTANRALHEPS